MRFRVLYVLCNGYGLALAIAAMTSLLGATPLAAFLTFWFGGALLCLAVPLLEQGLPRRKRVRVPARQYR